MVVFERFLDDTDFSATTGTLSCTTGKFTEVCSFTVGAKQQVAFGAGEIANGVDSRRTCTIRLDSAAGSIPGKIRLVNANANQTSIIPVVEDIATNWNAGQKLARQSIRSGEDGFLKIFLNPTSTTTIDFTDADTSLSIPVTVFTLD